MKQAPRAAHVLACDPLELGWAAGLFEGEGSIAVRARGHGKHGPYVALHLGMTDLDVVEHFQAVVGCGAVRNLGMRGAATKPFFLWQVASAPEVLAILEAFEPLFGARRRARAREGAAAIRERREGTCARCGSYFFAATTLQRYCSELCYTNRKREDEAARARRPALARGQLALEVPR